MSKIPKPSIAVELTSARSELYSAGGNYALTAIHHKLGLVNDRALAEAIKRVADAGLVYDRLRKKEAA